MALEFLSSCLHLHVKCWRYQVRASCMLDKHSSNEAASLDPPPWTRIAFWEWRSLLLPVPCCRIRVFKPLPRPLNHFLLHRALQFLRILHGELPSSLPLASPSDRSFLCASMNSWVAVTWIGDRFYVIVIFFCSDYLANGHSLRWTLYLFAIAVVHVYACKCSFFEQWVAF